jgi:hypothetical protein
MLDVPIAKRNRFNFRARQRLVRFLIRTSRSLLPNISPGISGRFHSLRFAAADQFKTVLTSASVILLDGLSSLRLSQLMTIGA